MRPLLLRSATALFPSSVPEESGGMSSFLAGMDHGHYCFPQTLGIWICSAVPRAISPGGGDEVLEIPRSCAHPPSSSFLRMKSQIKILAEVPPCEGLRTRRLNLQRGEQEEQKDTHVARRLARCFVASASSPRSWRLARRAVVGLAPASAPTSMARGRRSRSDGDDVVAALWAVCG